MAEFTERELLQLGFEWVDDGGDEYLQFILDKDNEFESDFLFSEFIGDNKFTIKKYGANIELSNWEVFILVNKYEEDIEDGE